MRDRRALLDRGSGTGAGLVPGLELGLGFAREGEAVPDTDRPKAGVDAGAVEEESMEEDESERRMVGIWVLGLKCRSTSYCISLTSPKRIPSKLQTPQAIAIVQVARPHPLCSLKLYSPWPTSSPTSPPPAPSPPPSPFSPSQTLPTDHSSRPPAGILLCTA